MDKYKTERIAIHHPGLPDRHTFIFWREGVFNEQGQYTAHALYQFEPPDVLNTLTAGREDIEYLEIGVDQGNTFDHIENVDLKHGVDPYGASPNITHRMASQLFFAMNKRFFKQKYDIIFIDALHLYEIVLAEIAESLSILKEGGIIVLHDTCPINEDAQRMVASDFDNILRDVILAEEKDRLHWHENTKKNQPIGYNGDVWKTVAHLRYRPEMTIFSIPEACVTILIPKKIEKFYVPPLQEPIPLTFESYFHGFEKIMNPVSMEYFKQHVDDCIVVPEKNTQ